MVAAAAWSRPTPSGSRSGSPTRRTTPGSPPGCRAPSTSPVRDRALLAHATQIDPEGAWFACPLEVQQEAWPTEDYELVRSPVESELPEDDLFAGVREQVERLGA